MTGAAAGRRAVGAPARARSLSSAGVFLGALALYLLTSYAGIRSPDAEVTFEVCDSLRHRGDFAVNGKGESSWTGFGLAPGTGEKLYSIFGPLQPIACVPFLTLADWSVDAGWLEHVTSQRSHYVDGGIPALLRGMPPAAHRVHARRSVVAWLFNSLVGAACVLLLFRTLSRLARLPQSAVLLTAIYATGTLAWPYSGTFLSEPLATLLVLTSFLFVIRALQHGEASPSPRPSTATLSLAAGVALGLAVAAHLTAILFVPFWLLLISNLKREGAALRRAMFFLAGVLPWLVLLAVYNHLRFGSFLESGRGVGADQFGYGFFQAPWRGLYGLTISPGKGVLLFCPAVLLGLVGWGRFHRQYRVLSIGLAGALSARLLFIATRSDWHGGFCLGPRLLVMALPLLLVPAVAWMDQVLVGRRWRSVGAVVVFAVGCSVEQLYFVVGEIFSFLHFVKFEAAVRNTDAFRGDAIYLRWEYSPLSNLLDGFRGPYLLRSIPLSNQVLWLCGAVALGIGWLALARWVRRSLAAVDGPDLGSPSTRIR